MIFELSHDLSLDFIVFGFQARLHVPFGSPVVRRHHVLFAPLSLRSAPFVLNLSSFIYRIRSFVLDDDLFAHHLR